MRKRNVILLAAALIILGGVAVWGFQHNREPRYRGRPLSVVLSLGERSAIGKAEAEAAMDEIGTNAIPTLLRMLQARDSRMKLKLLDLLRKQNIFKIEHLPAQWVNWGAVRGFYKLGARGGSAVPALVRIYERNISEESQEATVACLSSIGTPAKSALPVFIKSLSLTNDEIRINTIFTLDKLHAEPGAVVPEMIKCLKDPNDRVRVQAVACLLSYGHDARAAVPALTLSLKDPSHNVREWAIHALQRIDPQAAAKVPPEVIQNL